MAGFLPPLNVRGSFGAGPSRASNRVGSVFLGGMNIPAYPAFPVSHDFADRTAGYTRPVAGWGVVSPVEWAALAGVILMAVLKLRGV